MIRRFITAKRATGQARALKSDHTGAQRDYIVVPVVALMEGVIWPVNAESPEYVPAAVLAVAPGGWNGRPLMPNHPQFGGQYVSANDPRVLASQCFGSVFNACTPEQVMATKRLSAEAWIDVARAKSLGGEALSVLERCEAGELVDVSVGALTLMANETGDFQGTPYKARWTVVVPDHLAMLPEGVKGACSVDMGCGAPRAAASHQTIFEVQTMTPSMRSEETPMNVLISAIASVTGEDPGRVAQRCRTRPEAIAAMAAAADGWRPCVPDVPESAGLLGAVQRSAAPIRS